MGSDCRRSRNLPLSLATYPTHTSYHCLSRNIPLSHTSYPTLWQPTPLFRNLPLSLATYSSFYPVPLSPPNPYLVGERGDNVKVGGLG
jgi:hypothetical protein